MQAFKTAVRVASLAALIGGFWRVPGAEAAEWDAVGGKLRLTGALGYGAMWRTESPNPALVFDSNAQLLGLTGNTLGGKNGDDGDLNFGKGDLISMPVKGYLTLDYQRGSYGVLVSAKTWYDIKLDHFKAPWGNVQNDLTGGARLGTKGALTQARFGGIVNDNAYVHGASKVGGMPFDFKAGWQKLDWGNRFVVLGGLRDLNAVDLPGTYRPGAIPIDETRLAAPMILTGLVPTPNLRVELFWQLGWQRNIPNQSGTFFSPADWLAEGSNKVLTGNADDRTSLTSGAFFKRAPSVEADGLDQGGLGVSYNVPSWSTRFGFYATRFHSRAAFWSVIKSQRTTGAPFVPGDPGDLNPRYFTEFPEAIRMFALTTDTKWKGGMALVELSYRPNQPLQYNAADVVAAGASNTIPTPVRTSYGQVAPGAVFTSYERHENVQLQIAVQQVLPKVAGAQSLQVGGELVYKGVPDLPDMRDIRFGRSDAYGIGPVNGVCISTHPLACTYDGYVTKHAYGVRTRISARYTNVFGGMDLVPQITYGYDIDGNSGDGALLEGRNGAALSLRANHRRGTSAEVAWWPTWGGTYNPMRDRGSALVSVTQRF